MHRAGRHRDGGRARAAGRQAVEAAALAATLDARAAELAIVDQARSRWLLHIAATRADADRAPSELSARMAAADDPEPEVTAEEWLAAHNETMRMEDPHRENTDLVDDRELDDVRLKSWKILRKIRCSPSRATTLVSTQVRPSSSPTDQTGKAEWMPLRGCAPGKGAPPAADGARAAAGQQATRGGDGRRARCDTTVRSTQRDRSSGRGPRRRRKCPSREQNSGSVRTRTPRSSIVQVECPTR